MLYVIIRSQVMAFMCKAIKHETKEEKKTNKRNATRKQIKKQNNRISPLL